MPGDDNDDVRLDIHPASRPDTVTEKVFDTWRHGWPCMYLGTFLLGMALPEAIRWWAGVDGRVAVFPWLVVLGGVVLSIGATRWHISRRRVRIGVVVAALDPDGPPDGPDLTERAVEHNRRTCEMTFTVATDLAGDADTDRSIVERLFAWTGWAIQRANRFNPDAASVNLMPVMRLHLAFWFGAKLGRSPSRPIRLPARAANGRGERYFVAAELSRPGPTARGPEPRSGEPLVVSTESLQDGDPAKVALAVTIRNRGEQFDEPVRAECRRREISLIVWLRNTSDWLPPDTKTFTAALDQVERTWLSRLPHQASSGTFTVFLDTTVELAVAIGARLAGTAPDRWTACTRSRSGDGLWEQFPPAERRGGRRPVYDGVEVEIEPDGSHHAGQV